MTNKYYVHNISRIDEFKSFVKRVREYANDRLFAESVDKEMLGLLFDSVAEMTSMLDYINELDDRLRRVANFSTQQLLPADGLKHED